jgi:site-specific recombinase XerC
VEKQPRDRAIIEALYGTGARVDELVQLRSRQLVADIDGPGGYVTLYGKHGGRTIRVGRRTWDALQFLAKGKELDERIIAITDLGRKCRSVRRFRPSQIRLFAGSSAFRSAARRAVESSAHHCGSCELPHLKQLGAAGGDVAGRIECRVGDALDL